MFQPRARQRDSELLEGAGKNFLPALLILAMVAVVTGVPAPISAALLAAPVAAILAILNPLLIPIALIATVPVQDLIPVPEGVPITATRIVSAATVAVLPLILIRRNVPSRWSWFLIAILALMATMIISLWNAQYLSPAYEELYRWFVALVTFWIVLQFVRTRSQVLTMLILSAFLVIAQGAVGIVQALIGAGPASFQIGDGFSRGFGTFGMPNSYAAYLEVAMLPLIPIAVWAIHQFHQRWKAYAQARHGGFLSSSPERAALLRSLWLTLALVASCGIGLAAIGLSFSRGGWLGTIAALVVIVVLLGRRAVFLSAFSSTLLAIVFMATAPGAVVGEVQERFSQLIQQAKIGDVQRVAVTDENFATVERMSHWQTATAMWNDHPWIGVGLGNFNERFSEYAVHPIFDESQGHAHNYYLHLLGETGLIGLFAYAGLLVAAIAISWKAYRCQDPLARAIGIGALAMTTALIVHNVFENLHVLNISMHMMLIWALAVIAYRWMPVESAGTAGSAGESGT